jgi:predicted CXXCH cytochrome family protein
MSGSITLRFASLLIVAAGPVAVGLGADLPPAQAVNPYNDVDQTVHNFMPPGSVNTIKDVCFSCHVDGNIHIPGAPLPPGGEATLPAFGAEREQRPLWNQSTAVKQFSLSQNWPLPQPMRTDRPFGTSADCLGCHDGAFAADVHRGGERYGQGGLQVINDFSDWLETTLGMELERKSEVPDHPVSIIYPRKPDGELIPSEPVSSQRRYFSIPDLQGEELVLPTGPISKFYAQTPGNQQPPPSAAGNGGGQTVAAPPAGGVTTAEAAAVATASARAAAPVAATAAEGPERFRLIHTTFGVIHCDSCHNAHSELHAGFLRDKSPQLCLLCHDR